MVSRRGSLRKSRFNSSWGRILDFLLLKMDPLKEPTFIQLHQLKVLYHLMKRLDNDPSLLKSVVNQERLIQLHKKYDEGLDISEELVEILLREIMNKLESELMKAE